MDNCCGEVMERASWQISSGLKYSHCFQSTQRIQWPSFFKRRARWDPMKPPPPVTRIRFPDMLKLQKFESTSKPKQHSENGWPVRFGCFNKGHTICVSTIEGAEQTLFQPMIRHELRTIFKLRGKGDHGSLWINHLAPSVQTSWFPKSVGVNSIRFYPLIYAHNRHIVISECIIQIQLSSNKKYFNTYFKGDLFALNELKYAHPELCQRQVSLSNAKLLGFNTSQMLVSFLFWICWEISCYPDPETARAGAGADCARS